MNAHGAGPTITITRETLNLLPGRYGHVARKWLYSYSLGDTKVEYGTEIAALRGYLKRKYPEHTIREAWK